MMSSSIRSYLLVALVLVFSFAVVITIVYKEGQLSVSEKYFTKHSAEYLNGNKLDIPEEISQCKDLNDSEPDYMTCVRDSAKNIIHLAYDTVDYAKYYHEYQFDIDQDSITLYDKSRFGW
jgi:hypothetical protein